MGETFLENPLKATHPSRNFPFRMRGKGVDQLTRTFILGCSMGHSFDTTAALCGLRFGCSCSVFSNKNVGLGKSWNVFWNGEEMDLCGFRSIRLMKCFFESMEVFTKIPKVLPEALRWWNGASITCHSINTELRRFSQRPCQDKWDFADSTKVEKLKTKVLDDIKGPESSIAGIVLSV